MSRNNERSFLHDINNKLAVIDGRLNMLIRKMQKPEGLPPEDMMQRVQDIRKTVTEMAELTVQRRDLIMEDDAA